MVAKREVPGLSLDRRRDGLLDRVERINHLSHALLDRNVVAHDEHVALVDALEARDGDRAETVMASQIGATFRFVLDALTMSPSIQSASVTGPVAMSPTASPYSLAGRPGVEPGRVGAAED